MPVLPFKVGTYLPLRLFLSRPFLLLSVPKCAQLVRLCETRVPITATYPPAGEGVEEGRAIPWHALLAGQKLWSLATEAKFRQ